MTSKGDRRGRSSACVLLAELFSELFSEPEAELEAHEDDSGDEDDEG